MFIFLDTALGMSEQLQYCFPIRLAMESVQIFAASTLCFLKGEKIKTVLVTGDYNGLYLFIVTEQLKCLTIKYLRTYLGKPYVAL